VLLKIKSIQLVSFQNYFVVSVNLGVIEKIGYIFMLVSLPIREAAPILTTSRIRTVA